MINYEAPPSRRSQFQIKTVHFLLLMLVFCTCKQQPSEEIVDLPQIREKKKIVVATCNNAADYFVHEGEMMGFQYEVLSELGKYLDLKVEFLSGKNYAENLYFLAEKHCDIVVSGWLPSDEALQTSGVDTLYMERLVLVQRKPDNWKKMTAKQIEECLVRHSENLTGKTVYASGWSPLMNGKDFVADRHIQFITFDGISSEGLIRLVASGELDYAVCSWSEARLFAQYFDYIDIKTELGELPVGWLIRPASVELQQEIRQWLATFKKTSKFAVLYQKYHTGITIQEMVENKFISGRKGIISMYDEIFKKYSTEIGWDWRLLAALVYQESRFIPDVRSRKGAYGLMQLMPATLSYFGTDTTATPDRHIATGVAFIKYLDRIFVQHVTEKDERIKFILASYNIGPGHILDARRLAEKYGKDADVWYDNVDSCLLSKSDPKFYNDPDVRHGKCYGKETFTFVTQVLERYEHYKRLTNVN